MKKLAIAAAIIAAAFGLTSRAQAQVKIEPGTQIICKLHCHGLIFIMLADGTIIEVPEDTEGESVFEAVEGDASRGGDPSGGGGPSSTTLKPIKLTLNGSDPTYGDYSFSFDDSRPPTNTVITANQEDADFPATCDVYANVTGTIAGLPGTFTNQNECHMRSDHLQTFNPHVNEVYEFVDDVVFVNEDGTQFTIPKGATVTLN